MTGLQNMSDDQLVDYYYDCKQLAEDGSLLHAQTVALCEEEAHERGLPLGTTS